MIGGIFNDAFLERTSVSVTDFAVIFHKKVLETLIIGKID